MKLQTTAALLLVASALVGTHAVSDLTTTITGEQNVKANVCKGLVKDILTCALTEEWVSNACVSTPVCLPKYQSTFEDCKGSGLVYEDALPASATDMGYPAYASAATLTKALQLQGLVAIPALDKKSNFTKKPLECALPVTPTTGQSAQDAFDAAVKSCVTRDWDKVLYDLCLADGNSNGSPLAPDANGDLTYVLVSPTLNVAGVAEGCATVEARAKPNGNVFARVGKGFLAPATGNSNFGAPHDIFNGCWHDK